MHSEEESTQSRMVESGGFEDIKLRTLRIEDEYRNELIVDRYSDGDTFIAASEDAVFLSADDRKALIAFLGERR